MIRVINGKTDGWIGAEYVGRAMKTKSGSALGNPFKTFTHTEPAHQSVVRQYRGWLKERIQAKDPAVCQELNRLKQKALIGDLVLACWCKPLSCHGDVIKQYLEWAISNNVTFGA